MISSKFRFFCSWSGGKDSCLSLYHAIQDGGSPVCLLNMLQEDGKRSRSHNLNIETLKKQASALGIPLLTRSTTWDEYEANFISALNELKGKGLLVGIFGDIDIQEHRDWIERVCSTVNINPRLPLWKRSRKGLLHEFIQLGFNATIIAIKEDELDKKFLGRSIDEKLLSDLEQTGIDLSGENGEYHTIVTDGPIFSFPLKIKIVGQNAHKGYRFLDVSVA
ncbi:MAG: diphthine--ammonia ligase [Candidatus Helarchaeota archaeon]